MVPSEIRLAKDKRTLTLIWPDNTAESFSASDLRKSSQSAKSKRRELDGIAVQDIPDLTITEIKPIGTYAINIVFSDGYDRGIFPWKFLQVMKYEAAHRAEVLEV